MRIAVLGSGMVGQALFKGLVGLGHDAVIGTRDPNADHIKQWLGSAPGAKADTFARAAEWAEMAFLCTNWSGTENALQLALEVNLAGKIVVDVTNPLRPAAGGGMELDIDQIGSAGEQVQKWLPNSWVVKTLNVLNADFMLDAQLPGAGKPLMFVAGDNPAAKKDVSDMLASAGWQVVDLGGIQESRLLEAMAMLWIKLAVPSQKWDFAWQPVTLQHRSTA